MFVLIVLYLVQLVVNGKKFYIYEWPSYMNHVYPKYGAQLEPNSSYNHEFSLNFGLGAVLHKETGLFQTWQFSLYKNIIQRLLVSKYRTRNASEATVFILPLDIGVHCYIDDRTARIRLAGPYGWRTLHILRETFWKHHGHDHYLIMGLTAYHQVGIGVKKFLTTICENCSVLSIETTPSHTASPYYSLKNRKYWYAVPYPSSYHWWEGIDILPWIANRDPMLLNSSSNKPDMNRALSYNITKDYESDLQLYSISPYSYVESNQSLNHSTTEIIQQGRPLLSFTIGSLFTSHIQSNHLRRMLYNQCLNDSDCIWLQTSHSCNAMVNSSELMLRFQQSVFCPAPRGDSVTRKSLFDALICGCIPVIFVPASLKQYRWHLSSEEIDRISVYIPMQSIIRDGINYITVLRSISPSEIKRKQLAIEQIAPRLQYSSVPLQYRLYHPSDSQQVVWEPPFRDAVSVIEDNLLSIQQSEPLNGFTELQLKRKRCLQMSISINHEDYTGDNFNLSVALLISTNQTIGWTITPQRRVLNNMLKDYGKKGSYATSLSKSEYQRLQQIANLDEDNIDYRRISDTALPTNVPKKLWEQFFCHIVMSPVTAGSTMMKMLMNAQWFGGCRDYSSIMATDFDTNNYNYSCLA